MRCERDERRVKRAAICPICGQSVRIGVPAGGDGSLDVFFRHLNKRTGAACLGSRQDAEGKHMPHPSNK